MNWILTGTFSAVNSRSCRILIIIAMASSMIFAYAVFLTLLLFCVVFLLWLAAVQMEKCEGCCGKGRTADKLRAQFATGSAMNEEEELELGEEGDNI